MFGSSAAHHLPRGTYYQWTSCRRCTSVASIGCRYSFSSIPSSTSPKDARRADRFLAYAPLCRVPPALGFLVVFLTLAYATSAVASSPEVRRSRSGYHDPSTRSFQQQAVALGRQIPDARGSAGDSPRWRPRCGACRLGTSAPRRRTRVGGLRSHDRSSPLRLQSFGEDRPRRPPRQSARFWLPSTPWRQR